MVSRLDRLFILLDTGSSESVRLAAAKQLGEVQRVQPNDLNYLLQRIKEYSGKPVWDTRIAAGHATRSVLEQLNQWPPEIKFDRSDPETKNRLDTAEKIIEGNVSTEKIIKQFDLDKIVSLCPKLLSLDLDEVDDKETANPTSSCGSSKGRGGRGKRNSTSSSRGQSRKIDKEQLIRQRKLINKELGISMVDSLNLGVKSTDIVTNDDLQADYNSAGSAPVADRTSTERQDASTFLNASLSNYERLSEILTEVDCISSSSESCSQKRGTSASGQSQIGDQDPSNFPLINSWPISDITKQYSDDLFHPSWEIRHGAAIALREIIRLHGRSAGRRLDLPASSNTVMNQLFLVDMALRSICVLALDRFGDFLFDQVVAPVRENAAQLLGCCVANFTEENAKLAIELVLKMLDSPQWETRHGGVLGLKYCLNIVSESLSKRILEDSFDPIFKCLGDPVDDVSAEAAASLVPVKDLVIETVPDKAPKLIKFLWDHLANLDELTSSTSNIVLLLASLITSNSAKLDPSELIKSIPRLWSLLSHSSTSVRVSVLKAMITLIKPQESNCLIWMPDEIMTTSLRLLYQRSILENMEEVHPYLVEVWTQLIHINEDDPTSAQTERFNLLRSTSQYLNYWPCLMMQPQTSPIDRGAPMWLNIASDGTPSSSKPNGEVYIGSCTFNAETMDQQRQQVTKCRLLGGKLLGALYANLINDFGDGPGSQHSKSTLNYLAEMFVYYLKTKSSNQRIVSGWTIESWASQQARLLNFDHNKLKSIPPKNLVDQLDCAIQETSLCYDELASTFTRLQQETRDFVASAKEAGLNLNLPMPTDKRTIYNLNQIQRLCDLNLSGEFMEVIEKKKPKLVKPGEEYDLTKDQVFITLSSKKSTLSKSLRSANSSHKSLSTSVLSSIAIAQISWRILPARLSLVIYPLIDSIETEEDQSLLDKSSDYLVNLIDIFSENPDKYKDLMDGIIDRLMDSLNRPASLLTFEPSDDMNATTINSAPLDASKRYGTDSCRIIQLDNLQQRAEKGRAGSRRQSSVNSSSGLKRAHSLSSSIDLDAPPQEIDSSRMQSLSSVYESTSKISSGISATLSKIVGRFGPHLPQKLPKFWKELTCDIETMIRAHEKSNEGNQDSKEYESRLLRHLRLLEVTGGSVDATLRHDILGLFNDLIELLSSANPLLRHHSAQCIGLISKMMLTCTMEPISKQIIPMLDLGDNTLARCGAIETIALIIEHLQLELVPKINMFIIHVLRRMSDQNDQVRLMATHCFGKLLSLMPLNLERCNDSSKHEEKEQKGEESKSKVTEPAEQIDDQRFIEQLLDPKKLDNFAIPFLVKAQLRSYQQDGLNWLAFLNRFNLHGILCDEMGLGKTLMTICMVASDHHLSLHSSQGKHNCSPSLIVCPPTLTEHWLYETNKFLPSQVIHMLNPIAYSGSMNDRMTQRMQILAAINGSSQVAPVSLVVASYDIVRNDIDFFRSVNWNYCVLDEGHMIKNGKTKLSRAIRLLTAKHRLILSGTPIQNNVTELWSLFDYLMPGFLGSERQFHNRYAKPIIQSREFKCSARELEAGALAMESLHRQVLPFILRRLKEDVLDDLPPKIIQDYYCELSPLQHKLYEDFTRSKLCKKVTHRSLESLTNDPESDRPASEDIRANSKSHVFQALQYLKNVCNHPKLVLTEKHSQYLEIMRTLQSEKSSLDDIDHSSKLRALKQLLIDCGIGTASQTTTGDDHQAQQAVPNNLTSIQSVVNQHRALIFCQVRSMVNIIENDLLKKHLPTVTFLKLDGSVPQNQRYSIVSRFNNDPSIDILLLTTQIGGLGLNLTGADTVIFVEHDWNPTKDLQAIDRTHRIGQKKVVNVYRLITKGTLEEKIMGLQKFKTMVSNTVINQDNAGLGTMNVDQLFDLFEDVESPTADRSTSQRKSKSERVKSTSYIDFLPELWDQQQYETEYDLSNFITSLKDQD